ncbi:MAG: hypothetical protein ACOX3S_12130 [Anaerolineae bacterium]|jgi:hypothetical protein
MEIALHDRDILRRLAAAWAEVAGLPVHAEIALGWQRLNDLQPIRPMVWINEIPWHEMDVDGELTCVCEDAFCREQERVLRQTLYQWRHLPADMIVNPHFDLPYVIHDTGLGLAEDVDVAVTDASSDIVSRRFHAQIRRPEDLELIQMPVVTVDREASAARCDALERAIGDLLPVRLRGAPGFWFAPWDDLIRWWDVREAMTDLVDRPELVHAAMDRLTRAYLARLDQYEALNLLSRNDDNTRVGSGGYGYTTRLPGAPYDPAHPRPHNLWGCATAQIFSDVSPRMHLEFALQYERRWLDRWGLTYYGCCEPLHLKLGILQTVPNLRKISMSPWADLDAAVAQVGGRYVLSCKPNPAIFCEDAWHPDRAREDLRAILERTQGCAVELIMKDISTVRYRPQRLWAWSQLAQQAVLDLAA